MENTIWLVLGLLGVTIPLVAFARRSGVSYPIVLVLAGLALGFIPRLPSIAMDPNLVLITFLPPLLYWEAITAPTDAMGRHQAPIWILVLGLVTATTVAVAVVAHATVPHMSWAMAFVLGAIVAPTDELAATPVLDAMQIPRALIAIVEGESLLNDATSLIIYGAAIAVVVTGAFNLWETIGWFFVSGLGGVAVGYLCALLARELWRRVRTADLQVIISILLAYIAYLTATRLGLSGVLAAVVAGAVANRFTPVVITPEARIQAQGFWNTVVFLVNALLFLLVGLQLHALTQHVLTQYSWTTLIVDSLAINLCVVSTRIAWFIGNEYAPGLPLVSGAVAEPNWRRALVAAWSGLRGAVSLAAALAIPVVTMGGLPVPQRDLVIFLTFTVILVTLVGGGLTLPWLVKLLQIPAGDDEQAEIRLALETMTLAAAAYLNGLVQRGEIDKEQAQALQRRSERRLRAHHADAPPDSELERERELVAEERAALVALRARGEIDNTVLRLVQRKLDLAELALPRASRSEP